MCPGSPSSFEFKGCLEEVDLSCLLFPCFQFLIASLVAQLVKNLSAIQETWVRSLGWEDPLACSGLENSMDSPQVAKSWA